MPKLSTKISECGKQIASYLDVGGALVSFREDGTTWVQTFSDRKWRRIATKRDTISIEEWTARKLAKVAALPEWQRTTKRLPSNNQIREWTYDSVCETPSGDTVEPDGVGPDGAPSWLRILGLI
jgi:hypothetical protein